MINLNINLTMYLSFYLPIFQFVSLYLSIHLSLYQPIHLSTRIYPSNIAKLKQLNEAQQFQRKVSRKSVSYSWLLFNHVCHVTPHLAPSTHLLGPPSRPSTSLVRLCCRCGDLALPQRTFGPRQKAQRATLSLFKPNGERRWRQSFRHFK